MHQDRYQYFCGGTVGIEYIAIIHHYFACVTINTGPFPIACQRIRAAVASLVAFLIIVDIQCDAF